MKLKEYTAEEIMMVSSVVTNKEFEKTVKKFVKLIRKSDQEKQVGWLRRFKELNNSSFFNEKEYFYINIDTDRIEFGSYSILGNIKYTNWEIFSHSNEFDEYVKFFFRYRKSYLKSFNKLFPDLCRILEYSL